MTALCRVSVASMRTTGVVRMLKSLVPLCATDLSAFEERCWRLLRRRYPLEQLVYVPAEMGGDWGIEVLPLQPALRGLSRVRCSRGSPHPRTDRARSAGR
jgi:hypothetical protein